MPVYCLLPSSPLEFLASARLKMGQVKDPGVTGEMCVSRKNRRMKVEENLRRNRAVDNKVFFMGIITFFLYFHLGMFFVIFVIVIDWYTNFNSCSP